MLCQESFIWITLWEGRWMDFRRAQVALPGAVWGGCCCQTRCCRKLCCWTRMTLLLQMEPLLSAPRFYPIVCLFGNLSRAVSPAGLLDVWKTEAVCEQMGMFPYFCLQLSGTWLRLTVLRMLKKSAQKMPLQMQLERHLFLFTLISQDFFFPAWNPGLDLVCTERKGVGCLLMSLCPTSPTSRTSGIYGHLSLKLQSPAAASAHSPQSRGWAPSQALCTLQHC